MLVSVTEVLCGMYFVSIDQMLLSRLSWELEVRSMTVGLLSTFFDQKGLLLRFFFYEAGFQIVCSLFYYFIGAPLRNFSINDWKLAYRT